ncbi:MAG: multidrug effflux MFS transporter [Hyphomicrobiales bacterium]
MPQPADTQQQRLQAKAPPMPEFIAIIASMMAMTALSIDIMLPALPQIGRAFGLEEPNARQLVVTMYVLGFAFGQVVYGPLSDALGRKPVLFAGLAVFALASLGTMTAGDYTTLLAARALQGFGGGAPRVIAVAIVRDLHGGRRMARIMSFAMMVFIIIPIIAPGVGELLTLVGHWTWVFGFLFVMSLLIMAVAMLRLPETRPPSARAPLTPAWLGGALRETLSSRLTVGYTVATGFIFGCLMSYVNTAQQIFVGIFGLGQLFPLAFGGIAVALAFAAMANARLVERVGMRRLSHAALAGFVLVAVTHLGLTLALGHELPLLAYCAMLAANIFCFGFIMPNFNAIAMEPLHRVAGTASSFIGFFTTAVGAVMGWIVGQQFAGTVVPLLAGYAGLSALALAAVFVTERGRLFEVGGPS